VAIKAAVEFLKFLGGNTTEKFANQLEDALSTACGTGWKSPEEYSKLEASCAVMRQALVEARPFMPGSYHPAILNIDKALSTNPGQPLLDALKGCVELLAEVEPQGGFGKWTRAEWIVKRNATLTKSKEVLK